MKIIIALILIVGIVILLRKKLNVSRKALILICCTLVIIGVGIIYLGKFNILNEIHDSKETITQEEREKAIAVIEYGNILGIDAMYYETYYIYKNENNKYYYYNTSSSVTIAGPQEEKIYKKGNINNRKSLEKIIDSLEERIDNKDGKKSYISTIQNGELKLRESEYVSITYNGKEIEKQELLDKLFN